MPFAPATNAGSGHLLFAATSGFGKNLMGGLHDFFKNREESKGFDTLIENTAKMNAKDPKFLETFGDQLSKAPGMSLSQKRNLAGSLALYEQRGRQQQEMALKQADDVRADKFLQLQQDRFAAGQQQREAQGRMSEILARYAAAPASLGEQFATGTAGMDQPAGLTLDRYLAAAGEAKAQPDPRVLEQFIQNGQRQGLAVDPTPVPFSAGGLSGVFSPKTGQFQVDKPEPNPKDARMTVVLERDDMDRPTRTWTGSPKQYEEQFGKPMGGASGEGKPITREVAADFLKQAGGDKNKARELARKAGYTF